jgi:hypothetical protein
VRDHDEAFTHRGGGGKEPEVGRGTKRQSGETERKSEGGKEGKKKIQKQRGLRRRKLKSEHHMRK